MTKVEEKLAEMEDKIRELASLVNAAAGNEFLPTTEGFERIIPDLLDGDAGMTTDYSYIGGKRLTVPARTTRYLKNYLNGTTEPEWVAAMPETNQDADSEVVDVTKNRLHFTGGFGRD